MNQHNIQIQEIIEIATRAGDIAMDFYNKEYTVEQKQNKTPVTEADIAINDFLMDELSKYEHPILSEEVEDDFDKRKNADFVWIIDPLDGTSDFIQKTGEFAIMIGLVNKKGESVLGVMYAPELDELYYAEKDNGAYICHPKLESGSQHKIQVAKKSMQNGKILVSRNHLGEYEQEVAKKYNMTQIAMGSVGPKVGRIAMGEAELYINSSDKSGLWDICAADVILREAGGCMRDKNGEEISYGVEEVFLLNGYIASGDCCKEIYKIR